MTFVFTIPSNPIAFIFKVQYSTIGGGAGGTINIYVNGVLDQTVVSSDLDAETLNITP